MQIAVLGQAGSWYCGVLENAADRRGHECARVDFCRLTARSGFHASPVVGGACDLAVLDAVIVRTMPPGSLEQVVYRMDALARLEAAGVNVFNPAKAVECAVDKYLTTWRLESAGLRVPPTVVCEDALSAIEAFDALGRDVVVKPLFGAEGRGILRVCDPDLALRVFRTLERVQAALYVQKFIEHDGYDIRVLVLDGRPLGAIRRRGNGDFRTNISRNGSAEPHELLAVEADLALAAAKATQCRFAGVDLLYDRQGNCYVIEVNAVPGWRGFQKVTKIDVADLVIQSLEQAARQSPAPNSRSGEFRKHNAADRTGEKI